MHFFEKFCVAGLILALAATTLSSAIPKPDEKAEDKHKKRVIDKDLSEEPHFKDEDHNAEYDHEAFLGKEDAKTFDDLSPEESKDRLGKIYDKIDKNGDAFVSEEELKEWIKYVQRRYITDDTDRQWKEHSEDPNAKLTWDAYKKKTYGNMEENKEDKEDDEYNYKDMVKRDKKRWEKADADKDGLLSKREFEDFLHPEEVEHMRDIVVDETLDDIDKDKDGQISLAEYIGDMWPNQSDEEEPDWVKTEREQFSTFRDKNKDGQMDRAEVKEWIIPPDYDHSEAEAKHLMHESDADRDGQLTKDEVLTKYDVFVGSQATDFGEALTRHDEF